MKPFAEFKETLAKLKEILEKNMRTCAHTLHPPPGARSADAFSMYVRRGLLGCACMCACVCAPFGCKMQCMCGYVRPPARTNMCLDTSLSRFMYVRCVLLGCACMCAYMGAPFGCKMRCMCGHAVREAIYVRFVAYGVSCMCGVFC